MARSNHSNLAAADRFERRARRANRRHDDRRVSTRRQLVASAIREG